jgi:hypothetical protein
MAMIKPSAMPPRPTELGKIKIGGLGEERRTANNKTMRLPEKYDHFQVTGRSRDSATGNFKRDEAVHSQVGDSPTRLDVRLMFDTPEENFHSEFVRYDGRSKVWECDGETATNLNSGRSGPCQRDTAKSCKCKPYSRLAVILEAAPDFGGFYVFRTTSWESTQNLQTNLLMLHETFGSLRGLPLQLVLYEATDVLPDGGTSRSWKVGLVLRASFEEAARAALEHHKHHQLARSRIKLLASGVAEEMAKADVLEEEEIAAEFFHDADAADAVDASVGTAEKVASLKEKLGLGGVQEAEVVPEAPEVPETAEAPQKRTSRLRELLQRSIEEGRIEWPDTEAVEAVIAEGTAEEVERAIADLEADLEVES